MKITYMGKRMKQKRNYKWEELEITSRHVQPEAQAKENGLPIGKTKPFLVSVSLPVRYRRSLPAGTHDEIPEEALTAWEGGGWAGSSTALRGYKAFLELPQPS